MMKWKTTTRAREARIDGRDFAVRFVPPLMVRFASGRKTLASALLRGGGASSRLAVQSDVVDASWVQLLAAHHPCGRLDCSHLLLPQISKSTAAHWCIGAARMVRIALCWARATNRTEDAEREGCAAGLVPGVGDLAFEVDVDLSTCDFAALAEAAGAQLPPRHRAVAFHFRGRRSGPAQRRWRAAAAPGDAFRCGRAAGAFELAKTGPPLYSMEIGGRRRRRGAGVWPWL